MNEDYSIYLHRAIQIVLEENNNQSMTVKDILKIATKLKKME